MCRQTLSLRKYPITMNWHHVPTDTVPPEWRFKIVTSVSCGRKDGLLGQSSLTRPPCCCLSSDIVTRHERRKTSVWGTAAFPAILNHSLTAAFPAVLNHSLPAAFPAILNHSLTAAFPAILNQSLPAAFPAILNQSLPAAFPAILNHSLTAAFPAILNQSLPAAFPAILNQSLQAKVRCDRYQHELLTHVVNQRTKPSIACRQGTVMTTGTRTDPTKTAVSRNCDDYRH